MPNVYRIASASWIHAPGYWRWLTDAIKTQSREWAIAALQAFSRDRFTPSDLEAIFAGRFSVAVDGEVLVLTIAGTVNIARVCATWSTTHDPDAVGYDLFTLGDDAIEIEAVDEVGHFADDDAATAACLAAAESGDPAALRTLVILLARIAAPVIDAAERIPRETPGDLQVTIPAFVVATASRAIFTPARSTTHVPA